MIKAKLLNVITNLIRYFQDSNKAIEDISIKREQLLRLGAALQYIKSNYLKDIRLKEVADITFMNSNYFSTFFKKAVGLSFKEYVIKLRLNHSIEMTGTNKSITEIAAESGFNSISNYYKAYNKFHPL